jgi:hypothetical protein
VSASRGGGVVFRPLQDGVTQPCPVSQWCRGGDVCWRPQGKAVAGGDVFGMRKEPTAMVKRLVQRPVGRMTSRVLWRWLR